MAVIPNGLSEPEMEVYKKLIRVAQERKERGLSSPRPIVVITDVGKDYDDLAALAVLKELHRIGLVELRAVVANLMPEEKRARLTKAALDSLELRHVPVARGTRGSPEDHEVLGYEFPAEFLTSADVIHQDGQELLRVVYETAKEKDEKLYLLCLSSLQDIHQFASTDQGEALVKECTAEVLMQGGNYVSEEGKLEPDCKAANNRFNYDAAVAWHSFIQTNDLSSRTFTKIAAFATRLTSDLFVDLERTHHRIGSILRRVQVEQDVAFYKRACESDPAQRFQPFMDQKWFLTNRTNWYEQPHAEGDALPTSEEVIPYLTKIVLYDVHAVLGAAGEDVTETLKLFRGTDRNIVQSRAAHHIILVDEQSTEDPQGMSVAIAALLKGSLLAVQQGIASHPADAID